MIYSMLVKADQRRVAEKGRAGGIRSYPLGESRTSFDNADRTSKGSVSKLAGQGGLVARG